MTSTNRDDGCDEDAVTPILVMSVVPTNEMSASMEDYKELPSVLGFPLVKTLTNDAKQDLGRVSSYLETIPHGDLFPSVRRKSITSSHIADQD